MVDVGSNLQQSTVNIQQSALGAFMASKDNRIDYIEFTVPDIAAAKQFYSSVFGWKFTDYGPDYTSFNDGGIGGGFTKGSFQPSARKSRGDTLIVLYASKLSDARKKIIDAGGKIIGDLEHFPGGCRFYFSDPSGRELAVWSEKDT
jgi:predicted enzyme related to lactoylglutathione lyase